MKYGNLFLLLSLLIFSLHIFAATESVSQQKQDAIYMKMAIQYAKKNQHAPFGAVIIDNKTGDILGEGVNDSRANPILHGEMVAIIDCVKKHPKVDWSHATLYTTAEPCPMCQSAIIWAGIARVVYATSIDYLKAHGWNQITFSAAQVNNHAPFYRGQLVGGVLAKETDVLFDLKKMS